MDTEKVTTPFKSAVTVPARTRTFSGASSQVTIEQRDGGRPLAGTDDVAINVRRATESHWEWIIDRATD